MYRKVMLSAATATCPCSYALVENWSFPVVPKIKIVPVRLRTIT